MKNLVLGSLIAIVASQLAGCIITTGDDEEDGYITASWQIRNVGSNTNAPCPPGYDTAALYNQPVDSAGNNAGGVVIDLFDCDAGSGTSAPLIPGLYLSWIEIATTNNQDQFGKSLSAPVDITNEDKSFSAQILIDGGYFLMDWALVDAQTNAPLTCTQAGAVGGVEAIGTDVSNANNSASDIFDCDDHYGVTAGYRAATYTVAVAALNASEQAIGPSTTLTGKTIRPANEVTDLGVVTIAID
jgi:hypothetical protein